jgi:hypothetical protein
MNYVYVPVTCVAVTGPVEKYADPFRETREPCWRFAVVIACENGRIVNTYEASYTSKRAAKRARQTLMEDGRYPHGRELCFNSEGTYIGYRSTFGVGQ